MSILLFSPYGLLGGESGVMALLGNYLARQGRQVEQLRCNGAFSLCDRDQECAGGGRDVHSCFLCAREQEAVARWASIKHRDLTQYLSAEEILATKRWMVGIQNDALTAAKYGGHTVYDLCRGSFRAGLGGDLPDLSSKRNEQLVRRTMVSAARMLRATHEMQRAVGSTVALVGGTEDFLSRAFSAELRSLGVSVINFRWDLSTRCVRIQHPTSTREFSCPLFFEDVTTMRQDSRTWPWEIVRMLDEILVFLDLTSGQLELPMAAV